MMRRATIINLVPESDTDLSALKNSLKADSLIVIKGSDLRKLGIYQGWSMLHALHTSNNSEIIAINSVDWLRQPQRTIVSLLAYSVPAIERYAIDQKGNKIPLTWEELILNEIPSAIAQVILGKAIINRTYSEIIPLENNANQHDISDSVLQSILYMRTDLWYGVKAGGSVGHVAGVIDGFLRNKINVNVLSWDKPLLIPDSVMFTKAASEGKFRNNRELELLSYNESLIKAAGLIIEDWPFDAVYARYALNCFAPVSISKKFKLPLIIEYNGSEVWIEKNWGRGLKYPELSERIENLVLKSADLITVVSSPLRDELLIRGIDKNRIIVNPNAVDPDRFNPDLFSPDEMLSLRNQLGIPQEAKIAGFIGTFSPWHGVEVLAESIPLALEKCPDLYFLLIGSGPLYDNIKSYLDNFGVADKVIFTGIVPQHDAPKYLCLCDFFLSPHVPNPDGTPFFGSPTKLFEYMALGKGIIASDLDQLSEILEDKRSAMLVPPLDPNALSDAIIELYNNRDLSMELGKNARKDALTHHTWESHTLKILESLYRILRSS